MVLAELHIGRVNHCGCRVGGYHRIANMAQLSVNANPRDQKLTAIYVSGDGGGFRPNYVSLNATLSVLFNMIQMSSSLFVYIESIILLFYSSPLGVLAHIKSSTLPYQKEVIILTLPVDATTRLRIRVRTGRQHVDPSLAKILFQLV